MPVDFVGQSASEESSRGLLDATRATDKPSSMSVERFRGVGGGNTATTPTAAPHPQPIAGATGATGATAGAI
jgi:hypothetical protein